ncbi:MAG: S8 family serine peptidase [Chloroflexi bacterium]|nr:S8 family serine peptidase [Chloroflexota bacterium]
MGLFQAILLFVPTAVLAYFWRGRVMGAVFTVWALAAASFFLLLPVRLAGPTAAQTTALLQIVGNLLFLVGLVAVIWRQQKRNDPDWKLQLRRGHVLGSALLLAPLPLVWWLVYGALGSPLDTVMNLMVGLLMGLNVGLALDFFLVRPLQRASVSPVWSGVGGGLVAGVVLLLFAGGVGHNSQQLLLMPLLMPLGWAMMALTRWPGGGQTSKNWLAMAVLAGLNAAAPLMLLDPDELILVLNLGSRDILAWALYALLGGIVFGLLVSLVALAVWLWRHRAGPSENQTGWRPGIVAAALAVWLVAVLLYALVGQPGFHGERLFVILNDQADVSAAASMTDYDARRQFVYDTLVDRANVTQADIRATLDTLGVDYTPYYLVNAIEIEAGPFLRLWLNSQPEVDRILDSPVLRPLPALAEAATGSAAAPTSPEWNLTSIGAVQVWTEFGARGEGIVIGQSDSGVDGDHPELAGQYRGRDDGNDGNWFDPWNHSTQPTDIGGHGTHTLGSIVGQTVGVAPGAEWIGCVNLARNLANPALYLDCMQFMLAPFPLDGDPLTQGEPTRFGPCAQ